MDNFKWDEQYAVEFAAYYSLMSANETEFTLYKHLKNFIESKQPTKEYEILSVKCYGDETRYLKEGLYRMYDDGIVFELGYLLEKKDAKIYSVKRLSDGMVFTIGDNTHIGEVFGFEIRGFGFCVVVGSSTGKCAVPISGVAKREDKVPVLTAETGEPIYEGREGHLWYIKPNSWDIVQVLACNYWCAGTSNMAMSKEEGLGQTKKYKWFVTEESANNYVLNNKPCLSVNEIVGINQNRTFGGYMFAFTDVDKLKKIVKSKL